MAIKTIKLKKGKEDSLLRFHPWVFSGAVFNAWACPPVKRFEEKKQSNQRSAALQYVSPYFSYRFSPYKMFLLF